MAGQHWHEADDERHLAIAASLEGELHAALANLFRSRNLCVIEPVVGAALGFEERPGEQHILRRDWRPVRESRLRAKLESDPAPVFRRLDALGNESIKREGFVIAAREKGLVNVIPHARDRSALHDERVEAVERAEHAKPQSPALRRVRVDIIEMRKRRAVFRLVVHCNPSLRGAAGRACGHDRRQSRGFGQNRDPAERLFVDREKHGCPEPQGSVHSSLNVVVGPETLEIMANGQRPRLKVNAVRLSVSQPRETVTGKPHFR